MGEWFLSRRESTIVARHEVPGIMKKIAPSQRDDYSLVGKPSRLAYRRVNLRIPGYQPVPPGQKPFAHRSAS
jgi:hypothetical protein